MQLTLTLMTEDEARACVAEINALAGDIRALLLDMDEREGWKALGYPSWRACAAAEFEQSERHMYRLLTAARVEQAICPNGQMDPIPESHTRELAPLLDQPVVLREVYSEVQAATNGKPTAKDFHEHVERLFAPPLSAAPESPFHPDFTDDYVEDVNQEYEADDDEDTVADAVADGYVLPPRGLRPARKAWYAALSPSHYERIPPEDVIATAEPKELAQSLGSIERSIAYLGLLLKAGRRVVGHAQLEVVQ